MKIKNLKLFQSTLHPTPYTLLRLTTIFSMGVGSIIHKVSQYRTEVWCLISISKLYVCIENPYIIRHIYTAIYHVGFLYGDLIMCDALKTM